MKKKLFSGKIILFLILFGFQLFITNAQERRNEMHDTIICSNHQKPFAKIEIKSKADNHRQPAIFYNPESKTKAPLIVYLHSWSSNYEQGIELAKAVAEHNWNYISPDFRGPNNKPEACGSYLVISDIEDAIDFAIENANVNKNQIHIVGGSGGGYATLLCFMKIKHKINSFSAWNPITNLVDWYYESIGRQLKYSDHIFKATSSTDKLNKEEAMRRSPVFMNYPKKIRRNAKLFIYHGIHDGYLGQVPITHSLNFYNELIKKIDPREQQGLIPEKDIMDLLVKRCFPDSMLSSEMVGDRKIHYKKNYKNNQIIIFEGRHEMLGNKITLDLIPANEK